MEFLGFFIVTVLVAQIGAIEDLSYKLCTREGIQCRDCNTVGNCVPDGSNGYTYDESSDVCPGLVVCDDTTWYCARKGFCRFKKFQCPSNNYEDEVVFPDPYSCTVFHGCQGTEQYDYVCRDGTAFNPVTKNCSLSIKHRSCKEYPVPLCKKVGQRGDIQGNYMYECVQDVESPRTIYPKITLKAA